MANGAVNVSVPINDTTAQTSSASMSGYGVTHGSRTMNFYNSPAAASSGWVMVAGAALLAWLAAKKGR